MEYKKKMKDGDTVYGFQITDVPIPNDGKSRSGVYLEIVKSLSSGTAKRVVNKYVQPSNVRTMLYAAGRKLGTPIRVKVEQDGVTVWLR